MTTASQRRRYLAIIGVGAMSLVVGVLATPASAVGTGAVADLAGCTTNTIAASDDGSTGPVPIGFTANFAGTPYTQLYVNNNGNVTFDQQLQEFDVFDFTIPGNVIVAPFLADVDTRGVGSSPVTYGQTTFDGQPAFCVNWVDVGYFDGHADKRNSFQLLLVKRGAAGNFDIVFNYDTVQWETGDDADTGSTNGVGGASAAWGYANGDGVSTFVGPGSFVNGALLDGGPSSLTADSHGSSQVGRYVYPITAPTGPELSGQVTQDGNPVAFAPVDICPAAAIMCITRSTNATGRYRAFGLSGSYYLAAYPPADSDRSRGHAGPVTIDSTDVTQDIALGDSPLPPPSDTSITSYYTTDAGIPVVFWRQQLTMTTQGCPGGWGPYLVTSSSGQLQNSGQLSEGPAGTYSGPLSFAHQGSFVVHVDIHCPSPTEDEAFDFDVYSVPSGTVTVREHHGLPVLTDATVVLLRASSPTDAFVPVPDGSAVMSPANRFNPDVTVLHARMPHRFGWDVVAGGYYKIQASKPGCVSYDDRTSAVAESEVLTMRVPPSTLDLQLYCPPTPEPEPPEPPSPPEPTPGVTPTTPAPAPAPPPATPPAAARDTTAPNLSGLALTRSRFKVVLTKQEGGTRAKNAARGSTITFGLSEKGLVAFTIALRTTGRVVGGTCKARTDKNETHKNCTRWVTKATLSSANLAAGPQRVPFTGRVGTKALRAGRYRVAAVPTDVAGNRGVQRIAVFEVLRG